MTPRPPTAADGPALAALLEATLGGPRDPAALAEAPPHTVRRVLDDAAGPVAWIEYRIVADEAELCEIAVAPRARRRGLARALVAHLVADAAARGATALHLEVRRDNAPARALYAAAGFAPVGERRRYYADGADAVLYHRSLTPDAIGAMP